MKRLELLRYEETITKALDYIIYRIKQLIDKCDDEIAKMAFKHILNKLEEEKRSIWFSLICKRTFKDKKFGITDLDKIIVVDGITKALIEYKVRHEDFRNAIPVNAFQFITLQDLSRRSGVPLYYIIEISNNEYNKLFRVFEVDPFKKYRIKKCGNGHAKDTYVLIDVNESTLLDELEFRYWLKEVMTNGKL